MTQRSMSGGGRMKRTKTFPAGRICEAKGCTARLSIYNADHLCARCEETERLETHEAERLANLTLDGQTKKKSGARFYVGDGEFVDANGVREA
jgi:hypothetical protein